MLGGKAKFERWRQELRGRSQLTPEWRFWEDVLNARNQLLSAEETLAQTMRNLDEDEGLLRQWAAERHAKVEEVPIGDPGDVRRADSETSLRSASGWAERPAGLRDPRMTPCPSCGHENPEDNRFLPAVWCCPWRWVSSTSSAGSGSPMISTCRAAQSAVYASVHIDWIGARSTVFPLRHHHHVRTGGPRLDELPRPLHVLDGADAKHVRGMDRHRVSRPRILELPHDGVVRVGVVSLA